MTLIELRDEVLARLGDLPIVNTFGKEEARHVIWFIGGTTEEPYFWIVAWGTGGEWVLRLIGWNDKNDPSTPITVTHMTSEAATAIMQDLIVP